MKYIPYIEFDDGSLEAGYRERYLFPTIIFYSNAWWRGLDNKQSTNFTLRRGINIRFWKWGVYVGIKKLVK